MGAWAYWGMGAWEHGCLGAWAKSMVPANTALFTTEARRTQRKAEQGH
jgi:hypothetical protein